MEIISNIMSTRRYLLLINILLDCSQFENFKNSFERKFIFRFLDASDALIQTSLSLWYPLVQVKLGQCNQRSQLTLS